VGKDPAFRPGCYSGTFGHGIPGYNRGMKKIRIKFYRRSDAPSDSHLLKDVVLDPSLSGAIPQIDDQVSNGTTTQTIKSRTFTFKEDEILVELSVDFS
jgi:hypothetical protein